MDGKKCMHPVRVHGMCGYCGKEIKNESEKLFTVLHNNTNLLLNESEAERINEESYSRLMREKKMVLLLDLDQTVIHTSISKSLAKYYTELTKYASNPEDKEEMSIREINQLVIDEFTFYVCLRDNLEWFLRTISEYYEIHIYTMGNKTYGNAIARLIDKDGSIFGNRIVTRDDNLGCFAKDLKRLFPTNAKNVVILDDRMDVWGFCKNLFPIRPYTFFKVGDINSPELLQAKDKDPKRTDPISTPKQTPSLINRLSNEQTTPQRVVVDKILQDCISNLYDNELEKVLNELILIHKEFFSDSNKDVVDILERKKNIFNGCTCKIYSVFSDYERYLSALVIHFGGKVDTYISKRTTHAIIDKNSCVLGPLNKKIKCVNVNWVYESIYTLTRMEEDSFVCQSDSYSCALSEEEILTGSSDSDQSLYDRIISNE
ncbi:RNA polymerase II subunit A C-terminal domain phosphatase [Nematocida sp. AWRm80]|nr:RNA polymerase II subunit A C-terminal domain phosphatase [Nematocida sp. AWRm80]